MEQKVRRFKTWKTFDKATESEGVGYLSRRGHIRVSPADLVRALGKGVKSDEYKTSMEYLFKIDEEFITLYDWKQTSLYDDRLPSPAEFWAQTEPVVFNVGGRCGTLHNPTVLLVKYLHTLGCPASLYFYETDSTFSVVSGG